MNAEAWIALAGLVATIVVVPAFRLLRRIDRRLYSLWSNHIPHIYIELERITGNKPPEMKDE